MVEEANVSKPVSRWFIDLNWYQENNRSFLDLAQRCLCPRCSDRFSRRKKKPGTEDIITAIKTCCSQTPEYINDKLPILASVFRLLLANLDQPLEIGEIGKQLGERWGGDPVSPAKLSRILASEQWYGLSEMTEAVEGSPSQTTPSAAASPRTQ